MIGIVVAVRSGSGGGGTAAPTTSPAPGPVVVTSSSPAPAAGAERYLVDLPPDSGGGSVRRSGERSLRMPCGTGESDDRFREVAYAIPPAPGYRAFRTTVAAAVSGTPGSRPSCWSTAGWSPSRSWSPGRPSP